MSKIPNNNDGLNDADLASLFASDNREPPKELDKLILENARLSQHDSLPQQPETFIQKYTPIFGTAAVLMIAFALTPWTMKAPESTPDMAMAPAATPASESTMDQAISNSARVSTGQLESADSLNDSRETNQIADVESEALLQTPTAPKLSAPTASASNAAQNTAAASVAEESIQAESAALAESAEATVSAEAEAAALDDMEDADSDALGRENEEEIVLDSAVEELAKKNNETLTSQIESVTRSVNTDARKNGVSETVDTEKLAEVELSSVEETQAESEQNDEPEVESAIKPNITPESELVAELAEEPAAEAEAVIEAEPEAEIATKATTEAAQTRISQNDSVAEEKSPVRQNSIVVEMSSSNTADRTVESLGQSIDSSTLVQQNFNNDLQETTVVPSVDQGVSASDRITLAPDEPEPTTKTVKKDENLQARRDNAVQNEKPARVRTKNFRSSALLWVIEIKHLYNEKNINEAKEELLLFRKEYPDNDNERLLPKELLEAKTD